MPINMNQPIHSMANCAITELKQKYLPADIVDYIIAPYLLPAELPKSLYFNNIHTNLYEYSHTSGAETISKRILINIDEQEYNVNQDYYIYKHNRLLIKAQLYWIEHMKHRYFQNLYKHKLLLLRRLKHKIKKLNTNVKRQLQ
jgi:hypothetical protein